MVNYVNDGQVNATEMSYEVAQKKGNILIIYKYLDVPFDVFF